MILRCSSEIGEPKHRPRNLTLTRAHALLVCMASILFLLFLTGHGCFHWLDSLPQGRFSFSSQILNALYCSYSPLRLSYVFLMVVIRI